MNRPRSARVRELFYEALALEPGDRGALLDLTCQGDPELRREVERLLARDPGTDELPIPQSIRIEDGAHPGGPPPRIPGHRILHSIGSGGMGVVWAAEQESPRRRVAVKVIRQTPTGDDLHARLFAREIEALARLEHPGITRIYESGQDEDGQLYFTMELVEGEPLDRYLSRDFAGGNLSRSRLEANLRLFGRLCAAVHYAHQRGIIHRDLKPSNVLVTEIGPDTTSGEAGPRIKILDFGLARAMALEADPLLSQSGTVRGTLTYMSPEQARGDPGLDVRSDVYSLGVMLFQLLTDTVPHDLQGMSVPEAIRTICEAPLPAPRDRQPHLDEDLDLIARTALAKDVDERYPDAHALGRDIDRYLGSLPILARPPSGFYQVRKLIHRHRGAFALAAILLVSVAGIAVWMSALYARAEESRRRAEANEVLAVVRAREVEDVARFQASILADLDAAELGTTLMERLRAEVRSGLERSWVDGDGGKLRQRTEAEIADVLEQYSASVSLANPTEVATGLVDEGLLTPALASIEEEFADQPAVRARLLRSVGQVYQNLGRFEEGRSPLEEALALRLELHGEAHLDVAESAHDLATLLANQGQPASADSLLRVSLATRRALVPDGDLETGTLLNDLGLALLDQGQLEESEVMLRESLALRRKLSGDRSLDTAVSLTNLALVLDNRGEYEGAEALYREALGIEEGILGPDHEYVARIRNNLARVLSSLGRTEEATSEYVAALEIRRRALGERHPDVGVSLVNLAAVYQELGRLEEAEAHYREAIAIFSENLPADHPYLAFCKSNLAILRHEIGDLGEAESLYRQALPVFEAWAPDGPQVANVRSGLGAVLVDRGRFAEAEPHLLAAESAAPAAGMPPTFHADVRSELIGLYDAWHEVEPDRGHDTQAAEWRRRVEAQDR